MILTALLLTLAACLVVCVVTVVAIFATGAYLAIRDAFRKGAKR